MVLEKLLLTYTSLICFITPTCFVVQFVFLFLVVFLAREQPNRIFPFGFHGENPFVSIRCVSGAFIAYFSCRPGSVDLQLSGPGRLG